MILRIMLVIIAFLLIAAHFLRVGNLALVVLCALTPLLLLIRNQWSLIVLQLLAYIAAVIWLNTMIQLIIERVTLGQAWGGIVAILGTVTLVTVLAGALLNSPAIKARYTNTRTSSKSTSE